MDNWKKNLNNYWLKQAEKRENDEATLTYEEKINRAWKACNDYTANFSDDSDNFDWTLFKKLVFDYVKACLPEATDERCEELATYCLDLITEMNKKLDNLAAEYIV